MIFYGNFSGERALCFWRKNNHGLKNTNVIINGIKLE